MCILKKITGVLRAISGADNPKNFTSAIIAAGGNSVRFGGETTKQMTNLCGMPLVVHTLLAFEACDSIHEIIVVAKKSEMDEYSALCERYGIKKFAGVVAGGFTRQESVLNGLDAVSKKSKFVAIADAARCLITPEQIKEVCRYAYKYDAATAAHNTTDTVKIAASNGFIESTADRSTVWLAQTPQVFKTKLYRAAAYTALKKGFEATDDNSLVENAGHAIRLVECGTQNIKVTTVDDLIIAEAILKQRELDASLEDV